MASDNRFRLRYTFWLDHNNRDALAVADTIEALKNERSFTSVVRDGIMLVSELRQGKTDLLLKLFPWIQDALAPAPAGDTGGDDILRRIERRLDALELPAGNGYLMSPSPKRSASSDKPEPEIVITKSTSTDAAANFLASLQGLQNLGARDSGEVRKTR